MLPTTMVSRTKCQFWKGCESLHPRKINIFEPEIHLFFTMGNHLNPTFMFGFHVNLYGCFLTHPKTIILAGKPLNPMESVGVSFTILGNPQNTKLPKATSAPNSWIQSSPTHLRLRCVLSVGSRDQSRMLSTMRRFSACVVSLLRDFLMFQVLGNSLYSWWTWFAAWRNCIDTYGIHHFWAGETWTEWKQVDLLGTPRAENSKLLSWESLSVANYLLKLVMV